MDKETLVEQFVQNVNVGDIQAIAGAVTADVRLSVPGGRELAGEFTGRQAFLQFLGATMVGSWGTLQLATDSVFVNGDRAVWLGEVVAQTPDGELRNKAAHLVEFRGEFIASIRFYNHDQTHVDAFWSEAAA